MLDFIPIPREALTSEAFLGSEPVDRATWLSLITYSFSQLSGGRIQGAATWKNRKLEQLLGITHAELHRGYTPELEAPAACGKPVENPALACGKPVEKLRKTKAANSAGGTSATYGLSLWALIGDDVIVKFYPYQSETRIIASRSNGRKGGRPKGS